MRWLEIIHWVCTFIVIGLLYMVIDSYFWRKHAARDRSKDGTKQGEGVK